MSLAGTYDWHIDQGALWSPRLTWWTDATKTSAVDLTGFGCRLTVVELGTTTDPVLELVAPADITLGGALGTVEWSVQAAFTALTLEYELTVIPGGDDTLKKALLKGRLVLEPSFAVTP